MTASGRLRTDACFHFGFQPSITQEHLPSPDEASFTPNRLIQMLLGVPGFRWWRTENPRVGSSILSLATISIRNLRWQPSRPKRRCFHLVSILARQRRCEHAHRRRLTRAGPPEKRAQRLPMLNV